MKCLWTDWRKIGFFLLNLGSSIVKPIVKENQYWLLKSVIEDLKLYVDKKIELKQTDYNTLTNLVKEQMEIDCWCWDAKFWYSSISDFKTIISKDFVNRLKWIAESFDCDNFASLFCSLLTVIWGYNGVGVGLGAVLDKETKKILGYHAYNCILVEENGKNTLYLYEPQTHYLALAQKETNMEWGIYRTDLVIFY